MAKKTFQNSSESRANFPIYTMGAAQISALIERRFKVTENRREPQLEEVFRNILLIANEYVPSESGSVCLADNHEDDQKDGLLFIASFGEFSKLIPGTRLDSEVGISGKVFRSGKSCIRNDVSRDKNFFPDVDKKTNYQTRSILCIPIVLEGQVCGVLSLINRLDPRGFRVRDLRLMEIFCRYLSTSIQNLIDFHYQRELSLRDHLSGLHNDRYFYSQLRSDMEGCERYGGELSLIFIDLDHFKSVVDNHGHLIGSQVLSEVGRLLARTVRRAGATLARYGGDEYVVILPGVGEDDALQVGEQIRAAIAGETYLENPLPDGSPALRLKGHFTASVGVACYRNCRIEGTTLESRRHSFIRHADEAMYKAKGEGKNRVMVSR